ncbi:CAP domain-containing protein [Nonomuraea typhae]|uniref:CAP domain-containing protein n=1 Tax=Nonomuraea typhae TaxID=2603600 RepID=A0ABW7Z953_9ACTN
MRHATHMLRAGSAAIAATALSLTTAMSSSQPAATRSVTATERAGASACPNIDMVYRDRSAFPNTPKGRRAYGMQSVTIEHAVVCLVNAARKAPLKRPVALRGAPLGLGGAAHRHVQDAVRLRWWGTVEEIKNCIPSAQDPNRCDTHINPQNKSTPQSRVTDAGYVRRCGKWGVGENTYTGWGARNVTPRAAFNAWMESKGHRDNILNPEFRETRVGVAWGSADPDAGSVTPALSYVQVFGFCNSP